MLMEKLRRLFAHDTPPAQPQQQQTGPKAPVFSYKLCTNPKCGVISDIMRWPEDFGCPRCSGREYVAGTHSEMDVERDRLKSQGFWTR